MWWRCLTPSEEEEGTIGSELLGRETLTEALYEVIRQWDTDCGMESKLGPRL